MIKDTMLARIRALMADQGMTQADLAEALGIHRATAQRKLTGNGMRLDDLDAIARVLQLDHPLRLLEPTLSRLDQVVLRTLHELEDDPTAAAAAVAEIVPDVDRTIRRLTSQGLVDQSCLRLTPAGRRHADD